MASNGNAHYDEIAYTTYLLSVSILGIPKHNFLMFVR